VSSAGPGLFFFGGETITASTSFLVVDLVRLFIYLGLILDHNVLENCPFTSRFSNLFEYRFGSATVKYSLAISCQTKPSYMLQQSCSLVFTQKS
jgi:hypothetical protein